METPAGVIEEAKESKAKDEPVQCTSLASMILDAPPSCIEFSTLGDCIFVVGTYSLKETEDAGGAQSRNGSLVLMQWHDEKLTSLQTHTTGSAVLDLHFSPHQAEVLAVATSTGAVEIYTLRLEDGSGHLERLNIIHLFESTVLVLSLAWHPSPEWPTTLAVSLSDGKVALVDYAKPTARVKVLEAHSLEAWTVAWSQPAPVIDDEERFTLYSGGDDSRLCTVPTIDSALNEEKNVNTDDAPDSGTLGPVFDSKIHGAGVTAILPFWARTERQPRKALLTGSYDEHVRVLVESPNGRWNSVAETGLGGGVWRLKMIGTDTKPVSPDRTESIFHVLASCMHAGARILQVRSDRLDGWSIKILAKFEEHESMNYGSDHTLTTEGGCLRHRVSLMVSTSFYDRKLCLWTFPMDGINA